MKIKTIRAVLVGLSLAAAMCGQTPASQNPPAAQGPPATPAPAPAPAPVRRQVRPGASGLIQGTVKDDTGGVIPGAVVTLANQSGTIQTVTSGADGAYTIRGIPPGTYTVSATYAGLQQEGTISVNVVSGQTAAGNIVMTVQTQRQEVTVTDTATNTVSTEPGNNSSALVLKGEDLDSLPEDPDDLEADLEALAGPAAGPGGNQIFIDGFTGGRLPPKESIREIRINSNPFSAEFDKLGFGRIQIFTKPGSDKFHGQGSYDISDGIWNSRNPFLTTSPPFKTQMLDGNISGPLGKHASFFIDAQMRRIDDNGIVTATVPTANFLGTQSNQSYYSTPQRRYTTSPRVDWQLGANNTLSMRYTFLENDRLITGIGGYDLPTSTFGSLTFSGYGYKQSTVEHTAQIVETAVLNAHAVNETHFQYAREDVFTSSQSSTPTLNVSQSFVAGGSGYSSPTAGNSYDIQNQYELQNYTSLTYGKHTTKFGVRIRADALDDRSPIGFNGSYSFLGTSQVNSIQQFLMTEQLFLQGLTSQQITAMGYGPSKFTMTSGNPYYGLYQIDSGPFVQDDWKVKPNLTVSLGLRWESQTNIPDKKDFAPRVAFAWSPDSKGGTGRAKTVIRGGWGMFYDRFAITNVLAADRSAQSETNYLLNNPTVYNANFTVTPPLSLLTTVNNTKQLYEIDSNLKAPRLMQTAIGIDRQLFSHTTLSVNFTNSRGVHELRTVDINAPYATPGAAPPGTPISNSSSAGNTNTLGVQPYGNVGDIYDYQSTGIFKQTQILININTSVGRWLTLFGRYGYGNAHSNTDGLGTQPADPYDIAADWSRSSLDIRDSLFIGGSINARWGIRFSPFIQAHTGTPFNITTGTDLYDTGVPFARPSLYASPYGTSIGTPYGLLYTIPVVPQPGATDMIPRNFGNGPGYLGINLRVSKTWGFGTTKFQGQVGGSRGGGGGGRGGGPGGGGFGGGPRGGGPGGGESVQHRYNLTLSVNARNMINHENLQNYIGTITSPYFLQSEGIGGGYGAEATSSNQRRIDIQLRFAF